MDYPPLLGKEWLEIMARMHTKDQIVSRCKPVFEWIKGEFERRLIFPSSREIVKAGLVSSTSQANLRLGQMCMLGWLERDEGSVARSYRIVGAKVVYEGEYESHDVVTPNNGVIGKIYIEGPDAGKMFIEGGDAIGS